MTLSPASDQYAASTGYGFMIRVLVAQTATRRLSGRCQQNRHNQKREYLLVIP